ncbi:hypothetical protein Bint_0234 [Brachyspira intermedia PWS/A]|uniref:Lipoprotein n=1 Tax=Brachyspira intermedia (strain ATCC 51140 / PWS/A) TaxID=1045858 RepID=G0EQG3_BRAIP|nr:hypothetical protein [Brachyspira intermedia]AEM20868.1 hypothetical protein Bint_0234 [Brachyspira intermedia PWS/A]
MKKILLMILIVSVLAIGCKDNVTNPMEYMVERGSDWTSRANVRANEKIYFGPIYIVNNKHVYVTSAKIIQVDKTTSITNDIPSVTEKDERGYITSITPLESQSSGSIAYIVFTYKNTLVSASFLEEYLYKYSGEIYSNTWFEIYNENMQVAEIVIVKEITVTRKVYDDQGQYIDTVSGTFSGEKTFEVIESPSTPGKIYIMLNPSYLNFKNEDGQYYIAPYPNYINYKDIEIEIVYTIIH